MTKSNPEKKIYFWPINVIHLRSRSFVERWPSCRACNTSLTASVLLSPIFIRPFRVSSASGDIWSLGGGDVDFCSTRRLGTFLCSWTCGPVFRSIRWRHRFITATDKNAVPHGGYITARLAEVVAMYRNTFISVSNVPFYMFLNLGTSHRSLYYTSYAYSGDIGVSYFRCIGNRQCSSQTTIAIFLVRVS